MTPAIINVPYRRSVDAELEAGPGGKGPGESPLFRPTRPQMGRLLRSRALSC